MSKTRYVDATFDNRDVSIDGTKLDTIEESADVTANNVPQAHNQAASTITDFDTEVGNNSNVVANTAKDTNATHTGEVTGNAELTIADDVVTYAKMQNVVEDERILGRVSGADGVVEELTPIQVSSMIQSIPRKYSPTIDISIDVSSSKIHDVGLNPTGTTHNIIISNAIDGDIFTISVEQSDMSCGDVIWFAGIRWPDGVVPTITQTLTKVDMFIFRCIGIDTYYGFIVGQNL